MAVTTPTNVDTSIPEIWARQTLRSHSAAGFWGRFIGREGSGAPIIQKFELHNSPGDLIHVQVTNPLAGAGIEGDTTLLEGSEEALLTSEIKMSPVLYRHAFRVWRRAQKKSILDLRGEGRMRLAEWGTTKMDAKRFELFAAAALPAPLASETYVPTIHTAGGTDGTPHIDDVAIGDKLTVAEIQKIKLKLTLSKARPITMDGFPVFILVSHPNAMFELKREAEYRDWVREAHERGKNNPFFRGAMAMVDGVVLFEHERVPVATNATSVVVAKGIAFGAEAFVEAVDESPSWDEDVFDYGAQFGMAYEFACQPRRALELSSIQVYAASTVVT